MDTQILFSVLAAALLIVSALGTIFPVLPGSLLTIGTLIGWAALMGTAPAWWAAGIGGVLALLGFSASAVLTGKKLKEHNIPRGSILIALLAAIIGAFVIPVVGLFIGFAIGLFAGESVRRRDAHGALGSSWAALKAMGVGILVEFGCVALASSVWVVGMITHFATR
ncbi:DUF456 domain-containing protein [Glutamicibacter endophyticus]|uniref:DUF456 domain-containing protein n=1 Tax=Glutamicibacter endophyticus TaxID=1522174 RepID=UPI003AF0DD48